MAYQSQLLRFLLRQTHAFQARSAQFWRQAQQTTAWGTQIAAMMLYGLWRSGRQTIRQLRQGGSLLRRLPFVRGTTQGRQREKARLDRPTDLALAADTSIVRVLSKLNTERPPVTALETAASIQAIACARDTQALGVITQAQDWVALTPDQQRALGRQITWELADYAYRLRRLRSPQHDSLLAWIWAAIIHFFRDRHRQLLPPRPLQIGAMHFSATLVPGLQASRSVAERIAMAVANWPWEEAIEAMTTTLTRWFLADPWQPLDAAEAPEPTVTVPSEPAEAITPVAAAETVPASTAAIALNSAAIAPTPWNTNAATAPPSAPAPKAPAPAATPRHQPWLEAEITESDYLKSPLVCLLEGLDRIIVRLEQVLGWLWQSLRRLIGR